MLRYIGFYCVVYSMTEACDPCSSVLSFLLKDGTGRILSALEVIPGYPQLDLLSFLMRL